MDRSNTYKTVSAFVENNAIFVAGGETQGAINFTKISITAAVSTVTFITNNYSVLSLLYTSDNVLGDLY